tara:strand:- start:1796 stop:2269 length:474 start_codon:yes stop_codon:yes gene_type:complete
MSLGKHLEGYTVDSKGRTLNELLKQRSADYKLCIANKVSSHDMRILAGQYWRDIHSLIIAILTNNGMNHESVKTKDDIVWFSEETAGLDGSVLLRVSPRGGSTYLFAISGTTSENLTFIYDYSYESEVSGKRDRARHAYKLMLEHLPEEILSQMESI